MTNDKGIKEDVPVDRRTETVVTEQPGYVAAEHVTVDAAAERRLWSYQVNRILWFLFGILEILLGLRFLLKLIGANAGSGFAQFIYGASNPFVSPFSTLLGTPTAGGSVFEFTTLIAMLIYLLLAWILTRIVNIIAGSSTRARTLSRTTREDTTGRRIPPQP